jgi:riboflavin kinase/FMN adenylyltransferase
MKIIRSFDSPTREAHGANAAIGFFDGVHIAHQKVIGKAVAYGPPSAAITFANSPAEFVKKTREASQLMDLDSKISAIEALGVDYLFVFDFNDEVMNMSADEFILKAVAPFGIERLISGFNFRMGKAPQTDSAALEALCIDLGIKCDIVGPVYEGGELVSSSLIRQCLASGDIQKANKLLSRRFCYSGIIEHGRHMGRQLGFPTINIYIPPHLIVPKWGVYESYTTISEGTYHSITNIGNRPTFGDGKFSVETHILDYEGDLYGQSAKVELAKMIRPEMKFGSVGELISQIARDVESIRL